MGVHDLDRYDEVRSALGIPEGEPLFIIRAKDYTAVHALDSYRRWYTQQAMIDKVPVEEIDRFTANMDQVISDFIKWRDTYPADLKFPD